TCLNRGLAPAGKGILCGSNRGIDFFCGRKWHLTQNFLSGRIDNILPMAGFGFDKFTINEEFCGGESGTLLWMMNGVHGRSVLVCYCRCICLYWLYSACYFYAVSAD